MDVYDYIVVGAGTSGCVVASRLAEISNVTICLLEAGPRDFHPYIHIPVGWMKLMDNRKLNWLYSAEPSKWTGGRRISVPRGKVLGGSSSINGNIFNRGAASDFDGWAQMGNLGWSYEDVLPLFKRIESWQGIKNNKLRGGEGKLHVTPSDWSHPLCEAFLDAAESVGIPRNKDYNGESQFGAAYTQRTILNGYRQNSAKAYLKMALKRGVIDLKTNSTTTRILIDQGAAKGIEYRIGGKTNVMFARREVIICGGVINSPHLLQQSGVGDPVDLKEIGIPIVKALNGVGKNLRDHYGVRFTAKAKNIKTFNEKANGIPLMGEVFKWVIGKPSILSLPATACYAFAKSNPILDSSDIQITFMPASYKEGVQNKLDNEPGMTFAVWQQRPDSTGFVKARSTDPSQPPEIQPNYLALESDQRTLLSGILLMRKIMYSKPMKEYFDKEIYPGSKITTKKELLEIVKKRGTTAFHMVGTCKMGKFDDPMSVVTPNLCVKGISNLRIADASIMPTMPSANTNACCYMIGEKASDLIKADYFK